MLKHRFAWRLHLVASRLLEGIVGLRDQVPWLDLGVHRRIGLLVWVLHRRHLRRHCCRRLPLLNWRDSRSSVLRANWRIRLALGREEVALSLMVLLFWRRTFFVRRRRFRLLSRNCRVFISVHLLYSLFFFLFRVLARGVALAHF